MCVAGTARLEIVGLVQEGATPTPASINQALIVLNHSGFQLSNFKCWSLG